jgi:16S rRNA (uracil1498-N3)-methyltransferase
VAHLYFVAPGATLEPGVSVLLEGEEARHAATVARLGVGEKTLLSDGVGGMARADVLSVTRHTVELAVASVESVPRLTPPLWLVQALAKGDRDERAVEACTELGVDRIIPWQSARSIVQWSGDALEKGVARWQRIARQASKQSLRAWVPEISPVMKLKDLCGYAGTHQVIVLDPGVHVPLGHFVPEGPQPVLVIVGPEGGITPEERAALVTAGASEYSLGPNVMRTSTAGVAALAVLNNTVGRW